MISAAWHFRRAATPYARLHRFVNSMTSIVISLHGTLLDSF